MAEIKIYPLKHKIKIACADHGNAPDMLLEILHSIQIFNQYIPEIAFQIIADCLNLSRAEVYGVVTFYHDFRQKPPAKTVVKLCQSEACQSMGSRLLKVKIEQNLSAIMTSNVDIENIYCLGNCALAPSALINGKIYGRLDTNQLNNLIGDTL